MISLTSPVRTRAHDWPAGWKLAGLSVATVGLFFLRDPAVQLLILSGVLGLYCLPGPVFRDTGLRRLRVLWPFVLIVLVWHGVTDRLGDGVAVASRLLSAVALANLVTMTTRLSDMIGVLNRLLSPFRALGLRTRAMEIAMGLAIRLTPVLLARAGAIDPEG